jgi:hypothetical protein
MSEALDGVVRVLVVPCEKIIVLNVGLMLKPVRYFTRSYELKGVSCLFGSDDNLVNLELYCCQWYALGE